MADKLQDALQILHHTAVCVIDFERALKFHTDFLGARWKMKWISAEPALREIAGLPGACVRWAMRLHAGGHRVKYYTPVGDTQPHRQCDVGYNHLALAVADVDAVYAQAMAAGYKSVPLPAICEEGAPGCFIYANPKVSSPNSSSSMTTDDIGQEIENHCVHSQQLKLT